VTSNLENWELKVAAIKNLNKDIVMLSDTRLRSKDGVDIKNRLKTKLISGPGRKYDMWENSESNKRGVAVLLARDCGFVVEDALEDIDQNIVVLKIRYSNRKYIVGAIYGPNNSCVTFYNNLSAFLSEMCKDEPVPVKIILGGDWNTVVDLNNPMDNLDLLNMVNIPNASNRTRLHVLMEKHCLIDPFRQMYPDKREYSYYPFGMFRPNRSRLDFFLISGSLLGEVANTSISKGKECKLFDHCSVSLNFGKERAEKQRKNTNIKNSVLKNLSWQLSVKLCAIITLLKITAKKWGGSGNYERN
jgi:exonuclease III